MIKKNTLIFFSFIFCLFFSLRLKAQNPEINVKQGQTTILDNSGSFDFGDVNIGTPLIITFTVENTGVDILNLSDIPAVTIAGTGFTLDTDAPSMIAVCDSAYFLVTFTPNASGAFSGTVSISNDDLNENPYNYTITGNGICVNPTPSISGNLSYCQGSSTNLDAGFFAGYLWSNDETTQTISATAGTFSVTVTDENGCSATAEATVTEDPLSVGGSISASALVCPAINGDTLILDGHTGNIIKWQSSTDGFDLDIVDINNVTDSLEYLNLSQETAYRAVVKSGECPEVNSNVAAITINSFTGPVSITGQTSVCASNINTEFSTDSLAGAIDYTWAVPIGGSIVSGQGTRTIIAKFNPSFVTGILSVYASNSCGPSTTFTMTIDAITAVGPTMPDSILATESNVCAFMGTADNITYSISPVDNADSYNWTIPANDSIVSGQGTTSLVVNYSNAFTSGSIGVSAITACGYSSRTRYLTINKTLPAIPGLITASTNNICSYMGTLNNVSYSIDAVSGADSYLWTVPTGGTIISGQGTISIDVNYDGTFTKGTVTVKSVSNCGNSEAKTLTIRAIMPVVPGIISGPTSVCSYSGGTPAAYTVNPIAGNSSYLWTVPSGASISSGQGTTSIDVSYVSAFTSGKITVKSVSGCGSSAAKTLTIKETLPGAPLSIGGSTNACIYMGALTNATYTVAPVSGVTSYNWTVPSGASIVSGQNTDSIDVSYNTTFNSGNISVQSLVDCGVSKVKKLAISKKTPLIPGTISGPASVCSYSGAGLATYSVTAVPSASSYLWAVPGTGASISAGQGSNSIDVAYVSEFTSGKITVKSIAGCGNSSAKTLTIKETLPASPGVITGPKNICGYIGSVNNAVYSIALVPGITSYNWTVPSGAAIVTGQGTDSISVSYGANALAGKISVQSVVDCGMSIAKTLTVTKNTVPSAPTAITGEKDICTYLGSSGAYAAAPVLNATSYLWTLPSGASIASGGDQADVTIDFASNFVSGNIQVKAVSACGSSANRSFSVSKTPAVPASISGPTEVCPLASGTFSVTAIPNISSYTWTTSASGSSIISGQTTNEVDILWANLFGNVCVKSVNACGLSSASKCLSVKKATCKTDGIQISDDTTITLTIYPNPSSGSDINVTLNLGEEHNGQQEKIIIYNVLGTIVYSHQTVYHQGIIERIKVNEIMPSGIYFMNVELGDYIIKKKILISY